MRKLGIQSKVARKFKATTDSNHSLPVAENLLNREFQAEKPNQKWVSDSTYVSNNEGWLYIAAVMDLYGQPVIELSMSLVFTCLIQSLSEQTDMPRSLDKAEADSLPSVNL